jgi:hypothetical protein
MRVLVVIALLLAVFASPMITQQTTLQAEWNEIQHSSSLQTSLSDSSGWMTGGEEITITGSGFSDLAFTNTTYDGINHQWTKTTADYGTEAGHENAIAVDSNGHVHIVHASGDGYAFTHSVYDGSSWTPSHIKNCEGSYCWDTHMVIDDNDELHAAYSSNNNKMVYMHYDGSSWSSTEVSTNAKVGSIGIALDSNNHPHISFAASGQNCGNGLHLASFDGATWTTSTIDSGVNKGCYSAIVIDENDHAYIAYQDRQQSKLKLTTNKSGSWIPYTPDFGSSPSSLYPGWYSSMAMDSQGQFHIAHYDNKDEDLRYSTGVPNGAWTTTIVDSSGNTGRNPSIAVDAAGDLHIVYRSWNGWKFKYATLNPSSPNWQVSTIENHPGGSPGGGPGESNSIFIDDGGMMHVAYSDETNGVLRYTTKSTGVSVTNEITVKFGQLGSVTAYVIDDSTIQLTTPTVANSGAVSISLIDHEGVEHQLSSTFEFIDQNDLDGDGIPNANDDCPDVAGSSTQDLNGCPDDDGDGYSNSGDAFPNSVLEWADTDGDGVGDNTDAFPNDSSETEDSDDDGVGDNSDAFPFNAFEQMDSDGDGVGDNSDAFPNNPGETVDSDGDGVGDNADAFPDNAYEQQDSDGDGVGDNTDAFPNDSSESLDNDGDGVGDLNDLCSNTIQDAEVDGNGCSLAQLDSDGDGYLDTLDTFPLDSTQWQDSDGDGYGDNWGDSDWNETRDSEWPGVFVIGAVQADHCPDAFGNSTANGFYGCVDNDGNGIPDQFQQPETNETDDENETQTPLDTDGDGVPDIEDDCPATSSNVVVDADGCEVEETQEDGEPSSGLESFFSGEADAVTTSVGVGAIILALFTLLQTNAVAAVLPDTFRWVQVLRKNSKLSKEERNELTYLQSLVQAYYDDPQEFAEELGNLKADLTARFTNNEIRRETREKLLVLIEELQSSTSSELYKIAHNDTYFGLSQVIDTNERTSLLEEKLAMSSGVDELNDSASPPANSLGDMDDKGTYWIEWPADSGTWHYRYAPEESWTIWDN